MSGTARSASGSGGGSRGKATIRQSRGRASAATKRLAEPVQVQVAADPRGRPAAVAGRQVEAIRDSWLVEDRWWTKAPIRRRYYEVVTAGGAVEIVYREPGGRWLAHK